jgi:hypothetical protein
MLPLSFSFSKKEIFSAKEIAGAAIAAEVPRARFFNTDLLLCFVIFI